MPLIDHPTAGLHLAMRWKKWGGQLRLTPSDVCSPVAASRLEGAASSVRAACVCCQSRRPSCGSLLSAQAQIHTDEDIPGAAKGSVFTIRDVQAAEGPAATTTRATSPLGQ